MSATTTALTGPDLALGLPLSDLPDGTMQQGHAFGEAVLIARHGEHVWAVAALCTHYGAPLVDGILVGDTVRCPFHHACFSLASGEAQRAPALTDLACYTVEQRDGKAVVIGKAPAQMRAPAGGRLHDIVIVGAGPAGAAAAEGLRRWGYTGAVTMIGGEAPVDRPNLSKDYLAGTADEAWLPLRPESFYVEHSITFIGGRRVTSIDADAHQVTLDDGRAVHFDALLLATGAEPIRPQQPGFDLPHVHTLRSLADSQALVAAAKTSRQAVVLGASFIGLEVAASLRARGVPVTVVAPDAVPLAKVLGPEVGAFVRALHEEHGVVFRLGRRATAIGPSHVTLDDGSALPADVVIVGVGVSPATELAERAGLKVDHGVIVNEFLETSHKGIYAAGDLARYPDPRDGALLRIEHFVVAERMGQTAARNLLGHRVPFRAVPFFWSAHYDVTISYVGHAERWDRVVIDGSLQSRSCRIEYHLGDEVVAVATIGRDRESLSAELAAEHQIEARIARRSTQYPTS